MSNQLIKQDNFPSSLTEAINMGKVFFDSGLFTDLKSAAQAVVKIQAGAELGIPPFAALSGVHIIQGKPTIGAGLMAAKVKGSGKYDYKVIQQDEKACIIEFYQGKEKIGTSSFTAADAQKAGTKNMEKYAKNMLFARAISNGVKWFTPDIFAGPVYTPEEMNEVVKTEDVAHEVTGSKMKAEPEPPNHNDKEAEARKATLSDKAFASLIKKTGECKTIDDLSELQNKITATCELSEAQADAFVTKVKDISERINNAA